jgi:hypothetical protein
MDSDDLKVIENQRQALLGQLTAAEGEAKPIKQSRRAAVRV